MSYAFVQDVAASWEQYEHLSAALRFQAPAGLIAHVAGPTDEGFRMIDIWASEHEWREYQRRIGPRQPPELARRTCRAFEIAHAIFPSPSWRSIPPIDGQEERFMSTQRLTTDQEKGA
jgi:hypothetical protein